MTNITSPGENDFIVGTNSDNHPGNHNFQQVAARYLGHYLQSATQAQKDLVINHILKEWREDYKGRILLQNDEGLWYDMGDEQGRLSISLLMDRITHQQQKVSASHAPTNIIGGDIAIPAGTEGTLTSLGLGGSPLRSHRDPFTPTLLAGFNLLQQQQNNPTLNPQDMDNLLGVMRRRAITNQYRTAMVGSVGVVNNGGGVGNSGNGSKRALDTTEDSIHNKKPTRETTMNTSGSGGSANGGLFKLREDSKLGGSGDVGGGAAGGGITTAATWDATKMFDNRKKSAGEEDKTSKEPPVPSVHEITTMIYSSKTAGKKTTFDWLKEANLKVQYGRPTKAQQQLLLYNHHHEVPGVTVVLFSKGSSICIAIAKTDEEKWVVTDAPPGWKGYEGLKSVEGRDDTLITPGCVIESVNGYPMSDLIASTYFRAETDVNPWKRPRFDTFVGYTSPEGEQSKVAPSKLSRVSDADTTKQGMNVDKSTAKKPTKSTTTLSKSTTPLTIKQSESVAKGHSAQDEFQAASLDKSSPKYVSPPVEGPPVEQPPTDKVQKKIAVLPNRRHIQEKNDEGTKGTKQTQYSATNEKENTTTLNSTKTSSTEDIEEADTERKQIVAGFKNRFDGRMLAALVNAVKKQPEEEVSALMNAAHRDLVELKVTPKEGLDDEKNEIQNKLDSLLIVKEQLTDSANDPESELNKKIKLRREELEALEKSHEKDLKDAVANLEKEYDKDYREIINAIHATWMKHNGGDPTIPDFIAEANKKWEEFWGNSFALIPNEE